jgi:hypothetical protein
MVKIDCNQIILQCIARIQGPDMRAKRALQSFHAVRELSGGNSTLTEEVKRELHKGWKSFFLVLVYHFSFHVVQILWQLGWQQ